MRNKVKWVSGLGFRVRVRVRVRVRLGDLLFCFINILAYFYIITVDWSRLVKIG